LNSWINQPKDDEDDDDLKKEFRKRRKERKGVPNGSGKSSERKPAPPPGSTPIMPVHLDGRTPVTSKGKSTKYSRVFKGGDPDMNKLDSESESKSRRAVSDVSDTDNLLAGIVSARQTTLNQGAEFMRKTRKARNQGVVN
jgi:hypothetical protein